VNQLARDRDTRIVAIIIETLPPFLPSKEATVKAVPFPRNMHHGKISTMKASTFLLTAVVALTPFTFAAFIAAQSPVTKTGEKVEDAARVTKDKTVHGVSEGAEVTKKGAVKTKDATVTGTTTAAGAVKDTTVEGAEVTKKGENARYCKVCGERLSPEEA